MRFCTCAACDVTCRIELHKYEKVKNSRKIYDFVEKSIKILEDFMKFEKLVKICESVTFKMTHFAFANKGQIQCLILLILTLIDKCKMCHFECHGLMCEFNCVAYFQNGPKPSSCYVKIRYLHSITFVV
jgi:hypothetical protein